MGNATFFGKYRGRVIDNLDPLLLGRVLVDVPQIPGALLNWALPCVPYAGPNVGFYAIPPIGANVWVKFEAGDPTFPIWSGCFWSAADALPADVSGGPNAKLFQSDYARLTLDDTPELGGITLRVDTPAVEQPLSITLDSGGISLTCGDSSITLDGMGVRLSVTKTVLAVSGQGVSVTVDDSVVTIPAPHTDPA